THFPTIHNIYLNLETDHKPKLTFKLEECEKRVEREVNNLVWCLENKDERAFYWVYEIITNLEKCSKRYRSTDTAYLVFEILEKCSDKKYFDVCLRWYKELKIKENFMCFTFLIVLIVSCMES